MCFSGILSAGQWIQTVPDFRYVNSDEIISLKVRNIASEGNEPLYAVEGVMPQNHWPNLFPLFFSSRNADECFEFIKQLSYN